MEQSESLKRVPKYVREIHSTIKVNWVLRVVLPDVATTVNIMCSGRCRVICSRIFGSSTAADKDSAANYADTYKE